MDNTRKDIEQLSEILHDKGLIGLDLSPGDDDCRQAANVLLILLERVEKAETERDRLRVLVGELMAAIEVTRRLVDSLDDGGGRADGVILVRETIRAALAKAKESA